jgi:hypothetical protein
VLSFTAVAFCIVYISVAFLEKTSIADLLSFQAADKPGPMPEWAYPAGFGNHYFGDFLIPFRISQTGSPYFAEGFLSCREQPSPSDHSPVSIIGRLF